MSKVRTSRDESRRPTSLKSYVLHGIHKADDNIDDRTQTDDYENCGDDEFDTDSALQASPSFEVALAKA